MNLNVVYLAGNLTKDPDLRFTPKGTAVGEISIAINRRWRNEAGEDKEEVTFVDGTVWGKQAENLSRFLKKGSPIFVQGRLALDSWTDKQTNQKRTKLKIVVEDWQFVGGKE